MRRRCADRLGRPLRPMSTQAEILRRKVTCETVVPLLTRPQREYGTESDWHDIDLT